MSKDFNYEYHEIDRALRGTPEQHLLTLKINGDEGATRHLNVSVRQVRVIRELLGGNLLEVLTEALGDARAYRVDSEEMEDYERETVERYDALAEAIGVKLLY